MGTGILLWIVGLLVNTILLLTFVSFVLWTVQWYLKRFRGVTVTVKCFRVFWIESIVVKTATTELMLDDIWLSVRLRGQRSLLSLYIKEIHLDKYLQQNESPPATSKVTTSSKAPSRTQRIKLALLFKLTKTTELSIGRLHVQIHNNECPDLMLSLMVLGNVTCSALPSSSVARCLGVNVTANNVKSTLLLDPEIPVASTDDGMLCLIDVVFSSNVIINVNTTPSCDRRFSSLHVNILPTYVNLLEGFDDHLLKLMPVHRSPPLNISNTAAVQQQQNVKTFSRVSEILSMKFEILFDDIQVIYRTLSPSEKQLSLNLSSLSLTTNQLTDRNVEPSYLQSFLLQISEVKVCHARNKVLATLKRLTYDYEYGATILKNSVVIESLHNFYDEREVNYWMKHCVEKISSKRLTKSSDDRNRSVKIPHLVSKAFQSPIIVISTVELSDCSVSLLLHNNCRQPFCDVVVASVELSCQCLEPEDCNGTDHRALRASVRVTDGYIFVPSDKNSLKKLQISGEDSPELLPSSKRHVWGRLLTLGSIGIKKIWRKYQECCATSRAQELGMQSVAYRTFCRYWQLQLGYIVIGKPRSDLCWTCQQNSLSIMRMANMTDKDKDKIITEAKDHIDAVSKERKFYREKCKASRDNLKAIFTAPSGSFEPPAPRSTIPPNSIDTTIHYSFDMAQQVHYPSDPYQPGPIYFLTPRKCALFGVCCEAVPRQAMLSVELLSTTNISDHKKFQVNSVSISATTSVLVGEWSSNMYTAVSRLLKHYQTPHGILKNQHSNINNAITDDNKASISDSTSLINKWCVLREDLEELDISLSFLDINIFLYNNTPSDPSLLLRMDSCCVKTLEALSGKLESLVLVAHCKSFILLPFSVEHVTEPFLCSTMATLPQGLVEIPSFNCTLNCAEKAQVTEMESLIINWSTHFHCTVTHITRCLLEHYKAISKILKPKQSQVTQQATGSRDHQQPELINLKAMLSKLPVSLAANVNNVAVHIAVDRRAKVSFTMRQASLSAKPDGIVEVYSETVAFIFDQHKILTIEGFSGQSLNDDCAELVTAREKFEGTLMQKKNFGIGLSATKALVTFPFDYKFTITFQKLLKVKKFLQHLHNLPTRPSPSGGKILLPDLVLQVDELDFQLNDDAFEVKLGTNFELQRDEQLEREKRQQALESALEKQRKEHGALLPAKKVQALYEALEQKDAQIYCRRAKEVHESESSPQSSLFLVTLHHAQLSILSDPTVEGVTRGSEKIKKMDPESPLPDNMQFDTLLGRFVYGEAEQLEILLRDYPQQFHKTSDFTVTGCIIVAEALPTDSAVLREYVVIEEPWENVEVTRTLTPLKIYYDLNIVARESETAFGVCYDACFSQINLAFENLIPTSIDPSRPLPYWDKIRLFFHGKYHIKIDQGVLVLLASRDPYDVVKHMDWQITNLDCTHFNGGQLNIDGTLNVLMHTASKYDDCRCLHFPNATCTMIFNWLCEGNPHDHHSPMPCVPERIAHRTNSEEYDTYANFRSKSLDWNINLDVQNTSDDDENANLLLYASTLRWLQSYYQVVRDISRPIRKGSVFKSVKVSKPTFFRSIRNIEFQLALPMGSIKYWGSFSQQRGVELTFKKAILKGCYTLTLQPLDDNLIRRPESKWEVVSLMGETIDVTCTLLTIGEAPPNKEAEQETISLRSDEGIDSHLLFTTDRIKYIKSKNQDEDNVEGSFDQLFQHQLLVNNTRFSWTFVNRSIITNLFDAYTKAQTLKKNLSAEAVRSIALILGNKSSSSPEEDETSRSTTSLTDGAQVTPNRHHNINRSSSGSKLLKQLLQDTSSRLVSHVEERAPSDPYLKGRLACSQDDVTKRNWFIELSNTQLALQGTDTKGFVMVTSTMSRILNYEHKPQWREGDLKIKKSWVAKVEEMQYFATLRKLSDIPWVNSAVISNLSLVQPLPSQTDVQSDQMTSVDTLLGELGPDSSSEQLDDKLFMTSPTLCRGEAVGGMVDSVVYDEYNEPVQLQRITSRCFCQIYYVNYGTEAENVDKDSVPPVTPVCSAPAGINSVTEAVNTFTIRHPSVEISTTSFQYSVIIDIINNLLLYKQSRRKEELGKLDRLRFSLQLGNIKDYKESVLTLQNKVRELLAATRKLERDVYLAQRNYDSNIDELDRHLGQHKAWLADASIKLSLTIRLLKECQLKAVTQLPHGDDVKSAEPTTRIEVWLDDAQWWLTQDDGQLHMCDITFTNCSYNQVSFSDDSAEHKFELGTFKVCNHLSNCRYPEVLYPHDPKCKKLRVDRDISLRIYCRDQAPVGGISVKEHFEINIIPLTVKISERFYNAIEKFFFPKKSADEIVDYTDVAHVNLMGPGSAMPIDVEESADGHVFSRKGSVRSTSKTSVTAASSTTSIFTTTPTKSKDAPKLDDVEQMKERAQQTKTFIYMKIPKIPLCISYKAEKGTNIKDVQDFMVTVPTLEYHNRNWTWGDMLMEVKKVYKQHIIQKGIKTVFGMREEDEAAKPSPLSIGGIDPSRLLMGKKYVKNTVKASRKLFKKTNSKSSSTADNYSDDEQQIDEMDDILEQSGDV